MALLVWLPLTGTLENKGLRSDIKINTNSSISSDNNGKIGSCYKSSNYTSYLESNTSINLGASQSMCAWFKFNSLYSDSHLGATLVSLHNHINNCGLGITIKYISSTTGYISANTGTGSSRTYNTYCGKTLLLAGIWYHATLTYSDITLKLYINGQLDGEFNVGILSNPENKFRLFSWSLTYTLYGLDGYLNDVRLYDHCLSPKEVKEISKGLVLHYPLNDSYIESTVNLANLTTVGGWNNSGNATRNTNDTSYLNIPGPKAISITQTSSGDQCITFGAYNGSIASKTFACSCYINISSIYTPTSKLYIRSVANNNTSYDNIGTLSYNGSTDYTTWPKDTWILVSCIVTTRNNETGIYFCKYIDTLNEKNGFASWQIEEKDHITPFTESSRTNNIVYDISGYENNGTITGTLSTSTGSPRYNKCTKILNYDGILSNSFNSIDICGLSLWVKNINSSIGNIFRSSNLNLFVYGNTYLETGQDDSPGYTNIDTNSTNLSNWTHIGMRKDDTTIEWYLNGIKVSTLTKSNTKTSFINLINTDSRVTGDGMCLSDVRVYVSMLSESDIKELYLVGASIDNSGNTYAYLFEEQDELLELCPVFTRLITNATTITNTGFTYDDTYIKFNTSNSYIYSEYIEIDASKSFYYDITYDCETGNQFYIGFDRFDENKTSTSNNSCVYVISIKPSSNIVNKRVTGKVTLATDINGSTTKYIRVRILNGWTGSTSDSTMIATIYNLSLKLMSNTDMSSITNINYNGLFNTGAFYEEYNMNACISKYGYVLSNQIIEY